MAAICIACNWSGTSSQVSDGRCPECDEPIRYESRPLQPSPVPERASAGDGQIRVGPALLSTDRAHKVQVERPGRRDATAWVPKSISQTTREGAPPQTIVWVPRWFAEKENLL